jgi:uncharacterized protein YecE (DUF72 family)
VKASRYITHIKRLKEGEKTLPNFYERIKYLGSNLGPILFQLPPFFKANLERLQEFISCLDENYRYVFEFRHPTWFTEETYAILRKAKIGLCITDLNGSLSPEEITTDFVYIRLHGPKQAYKGTYGKQALIAWQKRIHKYEKDKIKTYCYFDNDEKGFAIQDALELQRLLKQK